MGFSPQATKFLEDLQSSMRRFSGMVDVDPDSLDNFVRRRDLEQWGIATVDADGNLNGGSNTGDDVDFGIPVPPSNLVVSGGYAALGRGAG
jgi:hypothetical protein